MEEKELFQDYELNKWELSPRIYKIIGAAVAVHLFAFVVVGQFNLFGTKACDSPYVNKVCQVLDTAYTASVLLGTDTEFSSRDYEKTEIGEEVDVTFMDVGQQFTYPAGYFEIANPAPPVGTDPLLMSPDGTGTMPSYGTIPGIPDSFGSPQSLDPSKPAVLPTPNPNVVDGQLPNSPLGAPGNNPIAKTPPYRAPKQPRVRNPKPPKNIPNDSPGKLPELADANKNNQNSNATAQTDPKKDGANSEENKLFNKKPLEDFGALFGPQILSKEVDINAPFEITVEGKLDENGKIYQADKAGKRVPLTAIVKEGSDPKMTEVAKQAISAFSDSQLLRTLYEAGVRSVKITFSQNQDNLMAIIESDAGTANKAGSIQSSVNIAKQLALKTMKPESDEAKLIGKAETATNGKLFILNFLIPNDEKTQMIEKNLKSLQEKQKKSDNEGVANTAGKETIKGK